jgi:ABC-2 type transport system ATP-binding protein
VREALKPLIEVESLTKVFHIPARGEGLFGAVRHLLRPRYIAKEAVSNISFTINTGESVAYLGANGAGKSTTIKILTGILTPSSGNVRVDGLVPYQQRMEYVKKIGVVFGHRTHLWWDIPVIESLKLLKSVYDIPDFVYKRNLANFNDLLGLEKLLPLAVRRLSLGQRVRADLAAALLHSPPLIFLDEPTIGLDVDVKDVVRRFIRHVNKDFGTTVMLTSHDMTDIENLCERLIILERGAKVYDGDLRAIRDRFARDREFIVRLRSEQSLSEQMTSTFRGAGITVSQERSHVLRVHFDRTKTNAADVIGMIVAHYEVADFELREATIEQIIKDIFAGRHNFD